MIDAQDSALYKLDLSCSISLEAASAAWCLALPPRLGRRGFSSGKGAFRSLIWVIFKLVTVGGVASSIFTAVWCWCSAARYRIRLSQTVC
jgi:hypothetical protein